MPVTTSFDPICLSELTDEDVIFYKREGYLHIRNALRPQESSDLREEVMEIMKVLGLSVTKLKQTGQYLAESQLDALINSVRLRVLAAQLLGGPSSLYMPFTAVKSAGGSRFHFHQDNQYTRHDGPSINFWFALSPMNSATGALQIIPRTHKEGTLDATNSGDGDKHKRITWEPDEGQYLTMAMEPGDLVVFDRLTVHGSGANSTTDPRIAYAVQFCRNDTRGFYGGKWRSLIEQPRFDCRPVEAISKAVSSRVFSYD